MSTEHTQGSLTKEAIRLAWPAVCESFFIALAGMVDTFMVSTLGANAVAAVGLTTQPKFLGLALVHRSECSNLRPGGETIWREEAAGGQRDSGDDDLLLHCGSGDHQCTDGGIRGSDY